MANKPITIGGKLYPSQEWYDANVLNKGVKKIDTEAKKTQIQAGITEAQEQIGTIQAGISSLAEIDTAGAPPIDTNAGDVGAVGVGLTAADAQMRTFTSRGWIAEAIINDCLAEFKLETP